jgi:hypothetical protein
MIESGCRRERAPVAESFWGLACSAVSAASRGAANSCRQLPSKRYVRNAENGADGRKYQPGLCTDAVKYTVATQTIPPQRLLYRSVTAPTLRHRLISKSAPRHFRVRDDESSGVYPFNRWASDALYDMIARCLDVLSGEAVTHSRIADVMLVGQNGKERRFFRRYQEGLA